MVISAFIKCISKCVLILQGLMGERRRSWNSCAFSHKSAETRSGIQISKCTEIHPYQHFLQTIKFKSPFVITLWNTVTYFLPFFLPACHHTELPIWALPLSGFRDFCSLIAIKSLTLGYPYGQELLQAVSFGIKKEIVCPAVLPSVTTTRIYLVYTHQTHLHREFAGH